VDESVESFAGVGSGYSVCTTSSESRLKCISMVEKVSIGGSTTSGNSTYVYETS
jgi:hypothetical protein